MSKESIQFVELVREQYARLNEHTYQMYCEQCAKITPHVLAVHGDYEIYVCKCGCQREYRVK